MHIGVACAHYPTHLPHFSYRGFEATRAVVRYLIESPVRARLAAEIREYPHIGSQLWDREELIEWAYHETSG
jgi:hypothetical protein